MPNLGAALERIHSTSPSTTVKGRRFERLFRAALLNHPGEFRDKFLRVWLWEDWPKRDGPDMGIDLVAEDADGNEWAVQCKNYFKSSIPNDEINKFLAAAGGFHSRLFVSTSGKPLPKSGWGNLTKTPNCRVLTLGDLDGWPVDWAEFVDEPDALVFDDPLYEPYPYQQDAVEAIEGEFGEHDRGKLILPCGTGKSVVALWVAEQIVGEGGRVLYVVPSISLMGQTMREWSTQRRTDQRYIGVCSDSSAGKSGPEDANLTELSIPVTTNPQAIRKALGEDSPDKMTVVFSTYQSLQVIADAQADGAAPFDLMICDEAHRTTGVHKKGKVAVSAWLLPHDQTILHADRRLYMTATSRLYSANVREKAKERQVAIYSMDDESTYGPVFYTMSFKKAVDDGYLSDYEVAIVAVSDTLFANLVGDFIKEHEQTGVNVEDVVKLLGCWDALADTTTRGTNGRVTGQINTPHAASRAIAFSNTIKSSMNLEKWWPDIIRRLAADRGMTDDLGETLLGLQVNHIDGKTRASLRAQALNELDGPIPEGHCRLVTNAKCLTEGVDVPALDAVLFMEPRRSKIEIVQAVGRVMRRAEGKRRGYIVLPVIVPDGRRVTDSAFLRSSAFQPVWDVISALRAHDERMDVWVNTADIGGKPPVNLIDKTQPYGEEESAGHSDDTVMAVKEFAQMSLPLNEEIASALVERCGDKRYWKTWGDDVGEVSNRIRSRIETLIGRPDRPEAREAFDRFLEEMRETINKHIQRDQLVGMLASHLVTLPVFEALFGSTEFAHRNPVVKALSEMTSTLDDEGLLNEARELDHFYQSVKIRVQDVTDSDGRLRILLDLYETFFQKADPKEAGRSGIVYTPIEIVDFILRSADAVARQEFGKGLTDENVHILDPFTGTGTFINRILTLPDLIADDDLPRKYASELHANEWLLLPYYIAAVKIEQGYMSRRPEDDYQPFEGIVLTDTFELDTGQPSLPTLSANSERAQRQADLPIQVIVGNPPWSAGQKSAGEDNPNIPHKGIGDRITDTYAERSTATNKNSLQDLYKMAIRWATDRLGERGLIAFVTPNGYIDGNAEAGMRACLTDEFTTIHIFNLRGNANLSGEPRRREKGNVFGSSTRAGVSIVVMAINPNAKQDQCRILYRDIGDYLSTQEKRQILNDYRSVNGINDWQTITPDQHNDWINQRDATWESLVHLGHKDTKANKPGAPTTVMRLFSRGIATGGDPYLYSFDKAALVDRVERMATFYEQQRKAVNAGAVTLEDATTNDSPHLIKWNRELKSSLRRDRRSQFDVCRLRPTHHRPFVRQWLYYDPVHLDMTYRVPAMFPTGTTPNQVIGITGRGWKGGFSALITDTTPDIQLMGNGQAFPRYAYPQKPDGAKRVLSETASLINPSDSPGEGRVDNITDGCLNQFQDHYNDPTITKDGIWAYLYGVLHATDWRTKYASELRKGLPRIPFATDFWAFQEAGQQLIDLHLGYETCDPWPLDVVTTGDTDDPNLYRIDQTMRWEKVRNAEGKLVPDKSVLHINSRCSIEGIPAEAHQYEVNGKTPLEWARDRLKITTHKESGITNDANQWDAWADDPYQLVLHLQRLVRVSVETTRIVNGLPPSLSGEGSGYLE